MGTRLLTHCRKRSPCAPPSLFAKAQNSAFDLNRGKASRILRAADPRFEDARYNLRLLDRLRERSQAPSS